MHGPRVDEPGDRRNPRQVQRDGEHFAAHLARPAIFGLAGPL